MSVRRTAVRSLGVLALVAPMSLSVLIATAPAAFAATSFSSPTNGQVFTTQSTISVKGTVPRCSLLAQSCPTINLTVSSPDGSNTSAVPKQESTQGTGVIEVVISVTSTTPNGGWSAQLSGDGSANRTFSTNYAPQAPGGPFQATGSGARDVLFTWDKGSEPDLTGYTLSDQDGTVLAADLSTTSASCSSGTQCSYTYHYGYDNPGTHDYQIVAKRSSAGGGTLSSSPSTASATLVAPKPTPSATSGTGGTTSGGRTGGTSTGGTSTGGSTGGSAGSTSGGSSTGSGSGGAISNAGPKPTLPANATNPVLAQRRAFALTFNAFSPSLGIPKLPPLPATDLPSLEQPLPLGTYKPALPYSPQSETTKTTSILSSPTAFVHSFTDSTQLATDIAVALILLLVAGHLRRYLGKHVEE